MQATETYRSEHWTIWVPWPAYATEFLLVSVLAFFFRTPGGGYRVSQLLKSTTYSPRTYGILKDEIIPALFVASHAIQSLIV